MKSITFLLFGLLVVLSSCTIEDAPDQFSSAVMAYYVPEKNFQAELIPVEKLTHIIFSFANVIDGEMGFQNPEDSGKKLEMLVQQKQRNRNLKVMIACGGWGAGGFSDMALSQESRSKFINSAIKFIERYQLDGIDIDWEYPGLGYAGIKARPEDKHNFTLLFKELRQALDTLDRPQILTFAAAGWKRYYQHIELLEVLKFADFVNIMTYDQIGANTPFTGHHTALGWITEEHIKDTPFNALVQERKERSQEMGYTWEPRSVENIIDFCLKEGASPEQLIVGAAFYGRAWKGVHPEQNGLYQPNGGSYIGWSAYAQIRREFETDPNYQRYWDPIAKAPYLYNRKDSIFISYDDTVSVKLKTQYALDKGLGGIMFWELGNDTKEENGLLDAIYEQNRNNSH